MDKNILLAHGSGGRLSHELIKQKLLAPLHNQLLSRLEDSAVFTTGEKEELAFTTDSYVVNPIFFPGGDIGKLAVCGTVNDLSMSGAVPMYLSLSLIIEEGFKFKELESIVESIRLAAEEAGVLIITGDTKVVNRGSADKLFINTSGIGCVPNGVKISAVNAQAGDAIILSGPIGDHGIAVISQREGLKFNVPVQSDCAPLNSMVREMLAAGEVHCMRDPTRGGIATALNELASQSKVGINIYEENIPVRDAVQAACELLGFDPLYVANEGKLIAIVAQSDAEQILERMRGNKYGSEAVIIGEVTAEHAGKVILKTRMGASRIVDMLSGELLPRIC